jgi:hypothetical protein
MSLFTLVICGYSNLESCFSYAFYNVIKMTTTPKVRTFLFFVLHLVVFINTKTNTIV